MDTNTLDLHRQLGAIAARARLAQMALEDEHEGRLRAELHELDVELAAVREVVASW